MDAKDPAKPVHVLFVGAGAVGCFYASRIHHPSHNIHTSLTARSNYNTIASSGVTLQTHTFGNYTFNPHAVFPSVDAATPNSSKATPEDGTWDFVIVTTKALPDISDDSALIAPIVTSPKTCIVLIQNGVGVEEPYRTRFPRNPIVSAVTIVSAEQIKPGVIRQNRWTRMSLGPYGHGLIAAPSSSSIREQFVDEVVQRGHECMEKLATWWTVYGGIRDVETHTELELQTIRWHKLCINAAFNPSAVMSGGLGNANQLRDPELREHIMGIMYEIWNAAPKVLGKSLSAENLARPEKIVNSTERNTGAKPSMLLDWEAGRPMELEVILGNPVRIARSAGVEMPRLQSLYALLTSMQRMREEMREERERANL